MRSDTKKFNNSNTQATGCSLQAALRRRDPKGVGFNDG